VERAERLLSAVSYRGVLARGFALVRAADGKPLRSAAAVTPSLQLSIEFVDGRVRATADGAAAAAPASNPAKPSRRGGGEGQGNLFGG